MRKRILVIGIAVPVFVLLTSITYTCVKKYCATAEAKKLYAEGLKVIKDKDNTFYPQAQLAYYDSLDHLQIANKQKAMIVRFFKANALLRLGQEKQAIEILEQIVENTGKTDVLAMDVRKQLALAYLRMGERNNCIANHSSGSCIFPIKDKGIYMDPSASQKAIAIYQEVLQRDSSDLESTWLLNLAYMTIGEYPQKVPPIWLIPGLDTDTSAYKVKAFTDMAGDLKLNHFRNMAGGSLVDDFNNDGYLDIITSSWDLEEPMHYFKNNADGTFTDISNQSGLSKFNGGLNMAKADYNNDGFTDILVLRGAWLGEFGKQPNTLLKNNGDGTFTDVTIESGILSFHPTQTATWADFNNDGWVDVFIGNETTAGQHMHPSELYINNQDGTFTNVAAQAGCQKIGFMKGVTSADYNNDGWPDIFVSCRDGGKILLKNKGIKSKIPQFENATHEAGLDREKTFTFPTWFWDYDNDGWPDIFVCGYQFGRSIAAVSAAEALDIPLPQNISRMYLYRNNHDGTFTDVSKETGLNRPVFSMGSNFGDIDNDGWPDMYLGTGNPDFGALAPNRMFKNIDGRQFVEVTRSARVGNLQKGHGVSFADVDNDGDQDIFIEVGGALKGDAYYNSLYINPGQNSNNWISVQLEGTKTNRSAIGAHIAVSFREDSVKRTVYMDVNSGGSFGGNPFRKEIGIGKAKIIDELIIKWPTTGIVQVFKNITPDQYLKIKEGSDQIEKMSLHTLKFENQMEKMAGVDCAPFTVK